MLPPGQWPHTAATSARTAPSCRSSLDDDAGRAVVIVAIDNLGKGAAGQAVQNANLMLGLPETTGLAQRDRAMSVDRCQPASGRPVSRPA